MNKQIQDAVLGYTSKESSRQDKLGTGEHTVSIVEWKVLHSRINWDESEKDSLPEFADPTPQLGLMFHNEEGVAWYRANMLGYKRWEDLTEDQQNSNEFERVVFGDQAYACKNVKGQLVRIKDKKRTEDAQSIVDQIMSAVGMTGQKIGDAMDTVVGNGTKLRITIDHEEYRGKTQTRIKNFTKVKEDDLVSAEFGS
jgi:hypothetical protein